MDKSEYFLMSVTGKQYYTQNAYYHRCRTHRVYENDSAFSVRAAMVVQAVLLAGVLQVPFGGHPRLVPIATGAV